MITRTAVLLMLALVFAGISASAGEKLLPPDSTTTGADLMDRLAETLGGVETSRGIGTQYTAGTTRIGASGIAIEVETWWARPNSFYMVFHMPDGTTNDCGFDGTIGWARGPGGPRLLSPDEIADLALDAAPTCFVEWREHFLAAELIGAEEIFYEMCDVLHLVPDQGHPRNVYISRTSGLPVKVTMDRTVEKAAVPIEMFLSYYRATDNLSAPWRVLTVIEGATETARIDRITSNMPLPDGIFALPDDIQVLVDAHCGE